MPLLRPRASEAAVLDFRRPRQWSSKRHGAFLPIGYVQHARPLRPKLTPAFKGLLDLLHQCFGEEGFLQETDTGCLRLVRISTGNDGRKIGAQLAQFPDQFLSVHVGQGEIGDDQGETLRAGSKLGQRLSWGRARLHLVSLPSQVAAQEIEKGWLVVDNQQAQGISGTPGECRRG